MIQLSAFAWMYPVNRILLITNIPSNDIQFIFCLETICHILWNVCLFLVSVYAFLCKPQSHFPHHYTWIDYACLGYLRLAIPSSDWLGARTDKTTSVALWENIYWVDWECELDINITVGNFYYKVDMVQMITTTSTYYWSVPLPMGLWEKGKQPAGMGLYRGAGICLMYQWISDKVQNINLSLSIICL